MTQDPTDKDLEAVKNLRMYFRNNPLLVWKYGASDQGFILWLETMLAEIRKAENAGLFHTSPKSRLQPNQDNRGESE